MKSETFLRIKIRAMLGGATMAVLLLAAASAARADDAANVLKSMTDYLSNQKTLSASFDSDIEIITPELQKIQFASSGQMKLSRPDKLRVRRTGGYADVELVYDGKTISIYGNNAKSYVQADLPGTVDHMIDTLQERSGVGLPGTDLLLSDAFDVMMTTVLDGEHVVTREVVAAPQVHVDALDPIGVRPIQGARKFGVVRSYPGVGCSQEARRGIDRVGQIVERNIPLPLVRAG